MVEESAQEIEEQAARWVARFDSAPSSAQDDETFQTWLNGDARRPGAYARMRAIFLTTERAAALGDQYDPEAFEQAPRRAPTLSRRRLLAGGGGIAAGLGLAAWMVMGSGRILRTRKGEVREFALADGSVVSLNTESVVAVRFTRSQRRVELAQGEALFTVAKDAGRPFVVRAGKAQVQAIGTAFAVTRLPDQPVKLLVCEGKVAVTRQSLSAPGPVRYLTTRMSGVFSDSDGTISISAVEDPQIQRQLAWREGRIAFEGESVREAVAEFQRYCDLRIVVDDPKLERQEIAGLFQINDPVGFAKAVAASLGAEAHVSDGQVHIGASAG